jgi:hypothetical protein
MAAMAPAPTRLHAFEDALRGGGIGVEPFDVVGSSGRAAHNYSPFGSIPETIGETMPISRGASLPMGNFQKFTPKGNVGSGGAVN